MSYAVVHMQKIKMGGVRGIENHNERLKESHTNPDIDYEKSHLNKDLFDPNGADQRTYYNRVRDRIKELELPKAVRKDAVVVTGFVCTSDKAFFDKLPQAEQDRFFKQSYDFLRDRYGEKNVVASTIHYDEKTPHMHCYIVPVTEDGRLSAKDIFTKTELRELQTDYHRHMKENGFDLERGVSADGKRKHVEMQEFKIQTKYDQLKEKAAELEKLESIDKSVNLHAEKGKLTYSTKEVEAIKDQNRALKVEIHNKEREIDKLKNEVSELQKGLSKTQAELKKTELPLKRLKDLTDENKALQDYLEKRPAMKQDMKPFEQRKEQAYQLGSRLVDLKSKYEQANQERRQSVEKTYKLDNKVRECDSSISDLRGKQERLNATQGRIDSLEGELERTTGFFKGKERKALQDSIGKENESLQEQVKRLNAEYNIKPGEIQGRIATLQDRKTDLQREKQAQIEHTNKCEHLKDNILRQYKYTKALSGAQDKGFREITARHDAMAQLPDQDARLFRISHKDRAEILDRMAEQNPNAVERCKANFKLQDEQQKTAPKVISKSHDWIPER